MVAIGATSISSCIAESERFFWKKSKTKTQPCFTCSSVHTECLFSAANQPQWFNKTDLNSKASYVGIVYSST